MSHFTVMVIGDDPETQLAPYDENLEVEEYVRNEVSEKDKEDILSYYTEKGESFPDFDSCYEKHGEDWNGGSYRKNEDGVWVEYSTYNPLSKWDWYSLGGRWSGEFIKLKHGARSGVVGEVSLMMGNRPNVDSALKKDIDFEAIRAEDYSKAVDRYKSMAEACGGQIPRLEHQWPLNGLEYQHLTIEEKRDLYGSQESVKLWASKVGSDFFGPQLEDYQCSEEEFAQRACDASFSTFAVVKDGEWYKKGEMGWWGMHTNEMTDYEWNKKVMELIESVSDNTRISIYDCHI